MTDFRTRVLSCAEHERLAFALLEGQTRGQHLGRLRGLTRPEQAESGTGGSVRRFRGWRITNGNTAAGVENLT
jgi:hypothetical protein